MLYEIKKNPRVTAKDLKVSLEQVNISVQESTICKTLTKHGVYAIFLPKKTLLHTFAKEHLDTPTHYREKVLWMVKTKVELFGKKT